MFSVCETEDITYDAAPSPQHPTQHQNGLVECRVSGQPIPTVSWRYRGRRIQTGALLLSVMITFSHLCYTLCCQKTDCMHCKIRSDVFWSTRGVSTWYRLSDLCGSLTWIRVSQVRFQHLSNWVIAALWSTDYSQLSCVVGGRYTQDMYGLRIKNITTADDGTYYCRAEVDSEGRYDERGIDVIVYSKCECAPVHWFACISLHQPVCHLLICAYLWWSSKIWWTKQMLPKWDIDSHNWMFLLMSFVI